MEYGYLIVSILVIGVAHYIRVLRWRLFIDVYEQPNMKLLLQALSIGYLCNFFLPFKMGDVIRSYIAGKKMRNGYPLSLSSIIVDRYLDIIVVGMLFGILSTYRAEIEIVEEAAKLYFGLAISILVFTIIVYIGRRFFKKGIKFVASIFNVSIEKKILHVAWALVWNFKDIILKINKKKLIIYTIVMWALYILSYILFSYFMTLKGTVAHWSDIVIVLFSSNSLTTDYYSLPFMGYFNISSDISVYFSIYMFTAAILMYAVSYINIFNNVVYSNDSKEGYLNLLPQLNSKEQLSFLESYFSDSNREYIYNYLKLNQSISIIRDFSAGSNATTMLCTDGEKTFFRKYAFGEDGDKLYQQIEWILSNKDILPLPEVLSYEHNNIYSYYDMPYNSGTTGLFSYVHSMPIKEVWKLISEALTCMEQSIYKVNARPADIESIKKYISSKVDKNIEKIENGEYIKPLLKYDEILINGVEYKNLNYFKKYLDNNLLADIFSTLIREVKIKFKNTAV